MGASSRRVRRPDLAPTVMLQGRVDPEVRDAVAAAAAASGVSVSFYLEAMLRHQMSTGGLPKVSPARTTQLELPLTA